MVFLLVAGIVLSFGSLAYLIDRKGTSVLLTYDKDRASLTADGIARDVRELMLITNQPDAIRKLVTNHNVPGNIQVALFSGDGTLYAGETGYRVPVDMFSAPREISFRERESLLFFTPLLNELACRQCHANEKNLLGVLMVDVSANKMHAAISEVRLGIAIFAIIVAVIGSLGLLLTLRKMVFSPLAALHKAAEKIGSGQLQYRVPIDSKDEFGVLASTFNHMAESIETSSLNLERAVQQRTMELEVVANLSAEVFRGDRPIAKSIDLLLEALTSKLGFGYASVCMMDRKTGVLSQDFKKGEQEVLCPSDISLADDHPIARAIVEARPLLINTTKLDFAASYPHLMVIPLISHQRKLCREVNLCLHDTCPAYGSADERCWLINGTLCRSPQAVQGKGKLFGCIHCRAFPVYGALLAGTNA